jgi:hypothetical protein
MPENNTPPVQPLVPDFVNVLLALLAEYGFPLVFLVIIATLFAIESWYANGRRIFKGARTAGGFLSRAAARAASRHWTRVAVAAVSTVVVIALQTAFVPVSYVAGSYLASPFDPARTDGLAHIVESQPFGLFHLETVNAYLKLDWIAAVHVAAVVFALIASYREDGNAWWPLWLTFPYPLIAFGGGVWVVVLAAIDILANLVRWDFTGPESWPLIKDGAGGIVAVGMFAVAYCLAWGTALHGTDVVKRHWSAALHDDPHVTR